MDLERTKHLAGVSAPEDLRFQEVRLQEMVKKLNDMLLSGNTTSQLDMIYQWCKTGHCNKSQFRYLINWWMHQLEDKQ